MIQKSDNYFVRALHDAKVDELIDTYAKNGYSVQRDVKSKNGQFDLVVKNDKKIDLSPLKSNYYRFVRVTGILLNGFEKMQAS